MPVTVAILVCSSLQKAQEAKDFLVDHRQYPEAGISVEKVVDLGYDSMQFDSEDDGVVDLPPGKFLVIGRK